MLGEVIERLAAGVLEVPIVRLREAEAVCPLASVTTKVNVLVPALTGVPDKTPDALQPRPVLQAPAQAVSDQV